MEYKGYKISLVYDKHYKNGCYRLQKIGSSSSCLIDKNWTKIKIPCDKIIYNIRDGRKHLDRYINDLKELKKKFKKVIDLKNSDLSKEEKVPKTIQAMKEGWEIIYGGYLKRDKWRGEFDFLIINRNLKSKFGDYSYEVIDTKNSNKPKPDHIIQLGMYTYILEGTQGVLPKRFTIF